MSGPLGQFVLVLSFPLLLTHILSLSSTSILSLSLSAYTSISPSCFPCFIFQPPPPSFHLLVLIPASGHPLTAVMTSFSGLREILLLAHLNDSLWWPRYRVMSPQRTASEALSNVTISLSSQQVAAGKGVFSASCCFELLFILLHIFLCCFISVSVFLFPRLFSHWVFITWASAWPVCKQKAQGSVLLHCHLLSFTHFVF